MLIFLNLQSKEIKLKQNQLNRIHKGKLF